MPRKSVDPRFHRKEQELIFKEFYSTLSKKFLVCSQKYPDFEHMYKHPYYENALWITEKLGLHTLMKIQQNYNVFVVHQFFATLVFGAGDEHPMTWMTGHMTCKSNFKEFVDLLGYPFLGANEACGLRMHSHVRDYDKKKLAPLYEDKDCIGTSSGLHTIYNLLLRLFRETIAPRDDNIDEIRPGTVNLLMYAHKIFMNG